LFQNKVFIIAEAGVNHNGSISTAKELIDCATDAGADCVKFQAFKAKNLVTIHASQAEYQIKNQDSTESQFEMLKKLELDLNAHKVLVDYAQERGILFLSTPFDSESLHLINQLGLQTIKIPSGEITNLPFLREIGSCNKKIIISTGMASLSEIKQALLILENAGTSRSKITVLHCNTEYPTSMKDVNLNAMLTIKNECSVDVGYSDHTLGIEVPIAACALGATVIEKHYTLDRSMKGPDHLASLEPKELKNMVTKIRNIEIALGDGIKIPSPSEKKNIDIARKSIVAKRDIAKGETFTIKNITTKRPALGISPMKWDKVIGTKAIKKFKEDDLIILKE
jgi:N,N'-diacetyllegionaminate synthase